MKEKIKIVIITMAMFAIQAWADDKLYNFSGATLMNWNFNEKGEIIKEVSGESDLFIEVKGAYPENEVSLGNSIPLKPKTPYIIIISYRTSEVMENTGLKESYMIKPGIPSMRLIFADGSNKPVSKVSGYIWLNGTFKEETKGHEIVKRIFTTPDKTENLNLRLFFQCKGKYWIKYIKIEELDI